MTPADFTLSTPGANPLSALPPRRRTGARVEPFISGVTAVERNKILRSRNIRAGGTVNSAKIWHPRGRARTILSYPSPSLPLALRTAVRSIIRRTPFRGKKTVHRRLVFLNVAWCIARKTFRYKKGPFTWKKRRKKGVILFFLFLEGEREIGSYGGRGGKDWAYLSR